MRITRVHVANWRNFKDLDFEVDDRLFIVGPNASGKSNLLDLFKFLSDVASEGGGLASAITKRGGFTKVRSLFARNHKNGKIVIEVHLREEEEDWVYRLAFKGETKGHRRTLIEEEFVSRNGQVLLDRPNDTDLHDVELRTQTHLEQKIANGQFRILAQYFSAVRYFHPVPQVIRDPLRGGDGRNDPYGGDFIKLISETPKRFQQRRLQKVEEALRLAVPEFESLRLVTDAGGVPHLEAAYRNWRRDATWQNEAQFSDGTLRLIGLLWTLVSVPKNASTLLLLEEPELSLHSDVVGSLPTVLAQAQKGLDVQVFLSTHASDILDDETVNADEVLVLRAGDEGTSGQILSSIEGVEDHIAMDFPFTEILASLGDQKIRLSV